MYLKRMLIGLTVVFSGLTITACATEKRTAPQQNMDVVLHADDRKLPPVKEKDASTDRK
ncbi:MAG: hypothetical protein Q4C65_08950 [Eubacteriales bacterium]|nr:hypothetical protein [Eubacteriales bacterium]